MNEIEHLRLGKRIEEIARRVHDLELEEAPSDALFEYVESLEQKVLELTKRLDELDAKNKEVIEQAIAQLAMDSGLAHL